MIGIDAGLLIILFGIVGLCIAPARATIVEHRVERVEFAPALTQAFPVAAPPPALGDLAERAEAALEADALSRGIRDAAATYDQAARLP